MKLAALAVTSAAVVLLSAGVAAAEMQPIPNPPEAPHAKIHKVSHHKGAHHHKAAHHKK